MELISEKDRLDIVERLRFKNADKIPTYGLSYTLGILPTVRAIFKMSNGDIGSGVCLNMEETRLRPQTFTNYWTHGLKWFVHIHHCLSTGEMTEEYIKKSCKLRHWEELKATFDDKPLMDFITILIANYQLRRTNNEIFLLRRERTANKPKIAILKDSASATDNGGEVTSTSIASGKWDDALAHFLDTASPGDSLVISTAHTLIDQAESSINAIAAVIADFPDFTFLRGMSDVTITKNITAKEINT